METSLNLNTTENSILNAIWTLISNSDSKIQRELFIRLGKIQKTRSQEKPLKKGLDYVNTLVVGKGKVPADVTGKDDLADNKYSM